MKFSQCGCPFFLLLIMSLTVRPISACLGRLWRRASMVWSTKSTYQILLRSSRNYSRKTLCVDGKFLCWTVSWRHICWWFDFAIFRECIVLYCLKITVHFTSQIMFKTWHRHGCFLRGLGRISIFWMKEGPSSGRLMFVLCIIRSPFRMFEPYNKTSMCLLRSFTYSHFWCFSNCRYSLT